jgi:Yip1 domain
MSALRRIVRMVFAPREEWQAIAREQVSVDELLRRYILPLSLLAPMATVIGMKWFDASWDPDAGYLVPPQEIFAAGATTLFASIMSIFGLAGIFVLLAPIYGTSRSYRDALKVSTFGAVPVLLAGATLVLPVMAIVGLVGLCHSLYVFWLGAREVLHVNRAEQTEFIGVSLLMLSVASTFAGAAASSAGLL